MWASFSLSGIHSGAWRLAHTPQSRAVGPKGSVPEFRRPALSLGSATIFEKFPYFSKPQFFSSLSYNANNLYITKLLKMSNAMVRANNAWTIHVPQGLLGKSSTGAGIMQNLVFTVGFMVHVSCPYCYQKNQSTYELPHWTSMLVFPGLIGAQTEVAIGEKKLGGLEFESVRVGLAIQ